MPRGIPKNGINKGWFKKGQEAHNKGKESPWAKNLPQLFKKGHIVNHSEETRKKISLAQKGVKRGPNPEHSKRMKGRKASEETKLKMSLASKGRKLTEEQKSKLRGRKCSYETRLKIRNSHLGEKSHWWRGGKNINYDNIRKTIKYRMWRESVFERDNWTCQKCGQRGGRLEAHHIKNFALYTELRFDINNGLTLCNKCHRLTDNYGFKAVIVS